MKNEQPYNRDVINDMNAIDGVISDLNSRSDKPQGYPFSKIIVHCIDDGISEFYTRESIFSFKKACDLPFMKKLDFKKAGKVFGNKVQEMKNNLAEVPEEFLIVSNMFPPIDEKTRKTTGCRRYLIEVEQQENSEKWLVIQFRKAVKKYITEDLKIPIVPPIFGDKFPDENPENIAVRVTITIGSCLEKVYQALQEHGIEEFSQYPIRLKIPERKDIDKNIKEHSIVFSEGGTVYFNLTVLWANNK